MDIREFIRKDKVIVIVRRIYGDTLLKLAEALREGGVHLMELTFDQSNPDCITATGESILALRERFGDSVRFGAGTVLTAEQVIAAKEVGCEYIISPNVSEAVIKTTKAAGLISIPGAMTATEILNAHDLGADFVKLFPAAYLGTSYVKDIRAPISHVSLLATGGIREDNFGDFLKAGCIGAGISGRLTDKTCLAEGNFAEITRRAQAFRQIADEN